MTRYIVSSQGFFGHHSQHRFFVRAQAAARRIAKKHPSHGVTIRHESDEWPHNTTRTDIVQHPAVDAYQAPAGAPPREATTYTVYQDGRPPMQGGRAARPPYPTRTTMP